MKYSHKDSKLNSICGKKVRVVFWDNEERVGILRAADSRILGDTFGYVVDNLHFKKSHIKRVEEEQ